MGLRPVAASEETREQKSGPALPEGLQSLDANDLNRLASKIVDEGETKTDPTLPAPFSLAQAPLPQPQVEPPTIQDINAPADAIQRLEDAAQLEATDQPADAGLTYLSVLDDYPRTEASVFAYRQLADLSARTIAGEFAPEEVQRFAQNLPSWEDARSAESRYILLGHSWTLASQAKAQGDAAATEKHYREVFTRGAAYMTDHPDHPLQVFAIRHFEEAARALGADSEAQACNVLEQIARTDTPSPASWAARAVLANNLFTRQRDRSESILQRASMIEEWDLAGLDAVIDDPGTYSSVKAWYLYYIGHALFAIAEERTSLEYFDRILTDFPDAGPVREKAAYHRAFTLDSIHRDDPNARVQAYQDFIDNFPSSQWVAHALLRMAKIYTLAGDYEYADTILSEVPTRTNDPLVLSQAAAAQNFLRANLLGTRTANRAGVTPSLMARACGPIALHYLLASVGVNSSVEELLLAAGTTSTGTTMQGLIEAASDKDLKLIGVRAERPEDLAFPFIAFVDNGHFVFVETVAPDAVVIRDGHKAPESLTRQQFASRWNGEALVMKDRPAAIQRLALRALATFRGGDGGEGGGEDTMPADQNEECANFDPDPECDADAFGLSDMAGPQSAMLDAIGTGTREVVGFPVYSGRGMPAVPLGSNSQAMDTGIRAPGINASINAHMSSLQVTETDIGITTVGGLELNFFRTYINSFGLHMAYRRDGTVPYKNNIGNGWFHSFNWHLRNSSQYGTIVLYSDQGEQRHFFKTGNQVFGLDIYLRKTTGSLGVDTGSTYDKGLVLFRNPDTGACFMNAPGGHTYSFSPDENSVARITQVSDAAGNAITFEYDSANWSTAKLIRVRTPASDGRYVQLSYNAAGMVSRASLKMPASPSDLTLHYVDYTYSAIPNGEVPGWNENHYLTSVAANGGAPIQYAYESITNPTGPPSRYITTITDRLGNDYTFDWQYEALTNGVYQPTLIKLTFPDNSYTEYMRDINSLVANVVPHSAAEVAQHIMQYVPNSQHTSTIEKKFLTAWPAFDVWQYTEDANHRDLLSVTSPNSSGPAAAYSYTSKGRLEMVQPETGPAVTWEYEPDKLYPTKKVHPELGETLYDYNDVFGGTFQLEQVTGPFEDDFDDRDLNGWSWTGTWDADSGEARNTLDASGKQLYRTQTDPDTDLRFTYSSFDASDPNRKLNVYIRYNSGGSERILVEFRPDRVGIRRYQNSTWTTLTVNNSEDTEEGLAYDVRIVSNGNNVTVYRAPAGHPLQQVLSTTSATVSTTATLRFVATANSLFSIDNVVLGSDNLKTITTYDYYPTGNVQFLTVNGSVTTYEYDTNGYLAAVIQPNTDRTDYVFDDFGNLLSIFHPDQTSSNYWYEHPVYPDKVTKRVTSDGTETHFTYDAAGNLETQFEPGNVNFKRYIYDTLNRLIRIEDEQGAAIKTVGYDDSGRPATVWQDGEGTTTYLYDHMHRVKQITRPDGSERHHVYNDLGKLTAVTDESGAPVPFHPASQPTCSAYSGIQPKDPTPNGPTAPGDENDPCRGTPCCLAKVNDETVTIDPYTGLDGEVEAVRSELEALLNAESQAVENVTLTKSGNTTAEQGEECCDAAPEPSDYTEVDGNYTLDGDATSTNSGAYTFNFNSNTSGFGTLTGSVTVTPTVTPTVSGEITVEGKHESDCDECATIAGNAQVEVEFDFPEVSGSGQFTFLSDGTSESVTIDSDTLTLSISVQAEAQRAVGDDCDPEDINPPGNSCADAIVAVLTGTAETSQGSVTAQSDPVVIVPPSQNQGCPKPGDMDGDGIPDGEDDDTDGDGIPNSIDPDDDNDGVPDEDDPCPTDPDNNCDEDGDGEPDPVNLDIDIELPPFAQNDPDAELRDTTDPNGPTNTFEKGQTVTIEAFPAEDFLAWIQYLEEDDPQNPGQTILKPYLLPNGQSSLNPTEITMDDDRIIRARMRPLYTVTVSSQGPGDANVYIPSEPDQGTSNYYFGTSMTASAASGSGAELFHWHESETPNIVVAQSSDYSFFVNAARDLVATFGRLEVIDNGTSTILIEGDVIYVTPTPTMPDLTAQLIGPDATTEVRMRLHINYFVNNPPKQRDDHTYVPPPQNTWRLLDSSHVWNISTEPGYTFSGGTGTIYYKVGANGSERSFEFLIKGLNPSDSAAEAYLDSILATATGVTDELGNRFRYLKAIARKESFIPLVPDEFMNQFNPDDPAIQPQNRLMPNWGSPDGWGLMQPDGSGANPPVTQVQLWNWKENADEGLRRLQTKYAESMGSNYIATVSGFYNTDPAWADPRAVLVTGTVQVPGGSVTFTWREYDALLRYNGLFGGNTLVTLPDGTQRAASWKFVPGTGWEMLDNANNYGHSVSEHQVAGGY